MLFAVSYVALVLNCQANVSSVRCLLHTHAGSRLSQGPGESAHRTLSHINLCEERAKARELLKE